MAERESLIPDARHEAEKALLAAYRAWRDNAGDGRKLRATFVRTAFAFGRLIDAEARENE